MNFLSYLHEVWSSSINMHWGHEKPVLFDVFVDPTSSDYTDLRKKNMGSSGVRFIADMDEKKIYVFSDEILHHVVIDDTGLDKNHILVGSGVIEGKKIRARIFGSYQGKPIDFTTRAMRKWLDPYFSNLDEWE